MKRYIKLLFVLLFSFILLTGCGTKYQMEFSMDKDSNMRLYLAYLFDEDMIDLLIEYKKGDFSNVPKHSDNDREKYVYDTLNKMDIDGVRTFIINDKYKRTKYTYHSGGKNYIGYIVSVPMGKIDSYSVQTASTRFNLYRLLNGEELPNNAPLFIKDGNTYKSNMEFVIENTNYYSQEMLNNISKYLDVSLVFAFPNPPKYTNGEILEGWNQRVKFDLVKDKNIDFEFTYDKKTAKYPSTDLRRYVEGDLGGIGDNIYLRFAKWITSALPIICIIIVGGILVGVLIIIIIKKKNNSNLSENKKIGISYVFC